MVSDEGIGIKKEDWPKLFKPFSKLEEGNLYNPNGIGLGLSICKDILN
jgi:signal transduction histidine kinase